MLWVEVEEGVSENGRWSCWQLVGDGRRSDDGRERCWQVVAFTWAEIMGKEWIKDFELHGIRNPPGRCLYTLSPLCTQISTHACLVMPLPTNASLH